MITLKNILDVAGETFKTAAAKGYTINAPITFEVNTRLNRALGRFIYKEVSIAGRTTYTYKIDISGRFNDVSPEFIDTVRHEIAHFIAFTSFDDMSHGPQWKKIAVDLGANPKSCVKLKDEESIAAAAPRKKRQVIRAQCACCPTLYKAKKEQYFQIQSGLYLCPKCKVLKLKLVTVG